MSEQRTILVTGATGKQGRSVIDALLSLPAQDSSQCPSNASFHILAMARDPNSTSAKALSKMPGVSVIQGDLNDPAAVFARHGQPIWGVFSVQINSDAEEKQGKAMVDAAAANGVQHFVYASGDRGGPEKSAYDQTKVKNFAAKFAVEKYLEVVATANSTQKRSPNSAAMTYTILRPVTFFENQSLDRHGQGFGRMWMQMGGGDRKLQMISTRDIGWFAARAFADPAAPEYRNAAVSLAGDELSAREAQAIFKEVTGKDFPMAPCLVGKALKAFLRDTVGDMFEFFENEGYGADVAACRRANPGMLDYRAWLKEYSGFV